MKRVVTTLLIAAFVVWAIGDAVGEFQANETAKFYSSKPVRLLYVLAIAVCGGAVAALYYRTAPSGQRRAKLFAIGGVAASLTILPAYWLFRLLPLTSVLSANNGSALASLPLIFVGGLAAGCWYEFLHILKTGKTRFL